MSEKIKPFALNFKEKIKPEKVLQVKGSYSTQTQSWEGSTNSAAELPTTSTVATHISVDVTKADTANDD